MKQKIYMFLPAAVLCIGILASLIWNIHVVNRNTEQIIEQVGQAFFQEIEITRLWNARHGGVYVPVTEDTQPNPSLKIPNRDIVTTDGRQFTMINPAYMTRQISEIAQTESRIQYHITSLNPIRPANKADEWETAALHAFDEGAQKQVDFVPHNQTFRYMAPLPVKEACLACHAEQGYQLGDVRGGISVTLPADPYVNASRSSQDMLIGVHALALLVGISVLFGFQRFRERQISLLDRKNRALSAEIEERNTLEQSLLEAKIVAESANKAKSEFLSNMSHEFRTPLNGVLGYAQILKRDSGLNTSQKAGVDVIERSGKHLLSLINDILDLSKIEAGKMDIQPYSFSLLESLDGVSKIIAVRAHQEGIRFHLDFAPDLPSVVCADEKRLKQVLLNLLGNAVKFTDQGSVTFRVKRLLIDDRRLRCPEPVEGLIESAAQQSTINNQQSTIVRLRFDVEDTGIGIAEDRLNDIFSPFEQISDHTRVIEGTGLGLTICRQLIRLMGGELQMTSQLGEGSRFWFELELAESQESCKPQQEDDQYIVGYTGAKRTILIVDDRWENRSVLMNVLLPLGFHVEEAVNGKEGLEKAVQQKPDVIFTDLVMPEMDGFELARQIRKMPDMQDVKIIAVSASVSIDSQKAIQERGFDDFISKPLRLQEVFHALTTYLELEWISDQHEPAENSLHQQSQEPVIALPPYEDLRKLSQYASGGDIAAIRTYLDTLEATDNRYQPFVEHIRTLAKTFQVRQIREFLTTYLGDKS